MTLSVARRVAVVASSEGSTSLAVRLGSVPDWPMEAVEVASLDHVRALAGTLDAVLYDVDRLEGHEVELPELAEVPVPVVALTRRGSEPRALELLRKGAAEVAVWDGADIGPVVAAMRRAAARSGRRPTNVMDCLPVGVLWKDRRGRVLGANPFVAGLAGVAHASQLVGRRDADLPWGRHAERHTADDRLVMDTGLPLPPFEETIRTADGRELTVEFEKRPLLDRNGEIAGLVEVIRDVTGGGPAARQRSTPWSVVEAADVLVLITDRDGRIRYVNPQWVQATGYGFGEVAGKTPRFLRSGRNAPEEYERLWTTILAGKVWQGRLVNRRADGSEFTTELTISPVRSPQGEIEQFLSVGMDVTGATGFHERLAGAQRMAALGRLSAGVAHDFNNLLGVVLTNADLLTDALAGEEIDGALRDDVSGIRSAAESGRDLVSALLAYSRRSRLRPEPTDLAAAVAAQLPAMEKRLRAGVSLHYAAKDDVPEVLVDPGALRQILLSLVMNAQEAMLLGGRIRVCVEVIVVDDAFVARRYWAKPGLYAAVRVADEGVGIEPDTLDLIYDPFFSTKSADRGTGLGLARAFGLMKQHDGYIYAESERGSGTTLHLLFPGLGSSPRGSRAERSAQTTESPPPAVRGLLYAEDNDALRRAGGRVLEAAGFRVFTAANGLQALDLFEAHRDEIQAVVSDLLMPAMGGGELYRRLIQRYGDVPFVLTTAHIDDDAPGGEHVPDHVPYLLKPWAVGDLLDAVNRALGSRGPKG